MMVRTGLEVFLESPPDWVRGKRLGLLCNPASVDSNLVHSSIRVNKDLPEQLACLLTPQHGYYGAQQHNMDESEDMTHPTLGIPVYSLYSYTRVPNNRMLEKLDIILVDLQDVGCRVYTFMYTMSYCMEVARKLGKKVVVLDRPNPLGGRRIEGNLLHRSCASFVGRFPIPMRHGMTMGELALYFNGPCKLGADVEVIQMEGWDREMLWRDTGLEWVPPSPNLPTPESVLVYPGQVLWEGTNLSEGRGTAKPFEWFGAPYLDPNRLLDAPGMGTLSGCVFRPIAFIPKWSKWKEEQCMGLQIHVTDPHRFQPYMASLRLLQAVMNNHPGGFAYSLPPYEYEYERRPIDLIIGNQDVRKGLEAKKDPLDLEEAWMPGLHRFVELSDSCRLY
ncbi:MAG: exo-beta-N-acetylmuramidase NamZ domain-containing protein [Desulfatibacillaceae bacterium]